MLLDKINRKNYIDTIKEGGTIAVLFGSKCGRCLKAKSELKKFPSDIKKYYCDIEKNYELTYLLGILYVPTLILYKDGQYMGRLIGEEINFEKAKEQLWERRE